MELIQLDTVGYWNNLAVCLIMGKHTPAQERGRPAVLKSGRAYTVREHIRSNSCKWVCLSQDVVISQKTTTVLYVLCILSL